MKVKNSQLTKSLAVFLLCMTPLLSLYKSHDYPIISNSVLFFLIVSIVFTFFVFLIRRFEFVYFTVFILGITGLINFLSASTSVYTLVASCLFVSILRDKTAVVVSVACLTILASLFISTEKYYPQFLVDNRSESSNAVTADGRAPVFHLIFDEAAGIETLEKTGSEGQAALHSLNGVLDRHGFTTIRDAHSSSMWSKYSLAHVMHLQEVEEVSGKVVNKKYLYYYFKKIPLFELLQSSGYEINVFQSAFIDFCTAAKTFIRSCYEYPLNSLSYFNDNGLNVPSIMVPVTLKYLGIYDFFQNAFRYLPFPESWGGRKPFPEHFASLSQYTVQSDFYSALLADQNVDSQYYLVHFMYPHGVFYHNRDCKIRSSIGDWGSTGRWLNTSVEKQRLRINSEERSEMYRNYFAQYMCFTKVLDELLTNILKIYPEAIIILHGDHSSRISTRHIEDSNTSFFDYLDQQNFRDLYPTLLAMKYPGNSPGVINCRTSLVEFSQRFFQGSTSKIGDKTRIIADHLFPYADDCGDKLPVLSLIQK